MTTETTLKNFKLSSNPTPNGQPIKGSDQKQMLTFIIKNHLYKVGKGEASFKIPVHDHEWFKKLAVP